MTGPAPAVTEGTVRTSQLARGMIAGGLPTVLAAGISLAVPLIGRIYLTPDAYAVWALASTVVTMSIVLDFGAPAYVMRVIAIGGSGARAVVRGAAASVVGSVAIGVVGALAWTVYPIRSDISVPGAGVLLFVTAGAASGVRAVLVVVTSALLAYGSRLHRGLIVLAQALLQLGLTWLLLARGVGVTSLVIATAVSSAVALVAALLVLRRHPTHGDPLPPGEFRSFATNRTLVAIDDSLSCYLVQKLGAMYQEQNKLRTEELENREEVQKELAKVSRDYQNQRTLNKYQNEDIEALRSIRNSLSAELGKLRSRS